jgi:predicted SAM-dependent methyltransferase
MGAESTPKWLDEARRAAGRVRRGIRARKLRAIAKQRLAEFQIPGHLLLNVGAANHHPEWINLGPNPDDEGVFLEPGTAWPLRSGCARAIRSEQQIEHLTWGQAEVFVNEAFRVLEPGGVCRICCPDLEGISRAYLERDAKILARHRADGYFAPTWSHLPNNYMRNWGHRYLLDLDALTLLLDNAGFTHVERTGFSRSAHPLLAGTDIHDPGELEPLVLRVDAVKPD